MTTSSVIASFARNDDGAYYAWLATALLIKRGFDCQQGLLEYRQIVLHSVPDDLAVDALVLIAQDVSDARDILPAHVLVL